MPSVIIFRQNIHLKSAQFWYCNSIGAYVKFQINSASAKDWLKRMSKSTCWLKIWNKTSLAFVVGFICCSPQWCSKKKLNFCFHLWCFDIIVSAVRCLPLQTVGILCRKIQFQLHQLKVVIWNQRLKSEEARYYIGCVMDENCMGLLYQQNIIR